VIAGGKLTTYRVMAKDAVDFALGERADQLPSITDRIPLVGAVGLEALGRRATVVARTYGWSGQMVDHLLHRYGSLLGDLVDQIATRPDLARPLEHAPAYLRAEIAYAATHEGVLHLEDVMLHRTRLNYEVRDRGLAALPEIAALTGEILGWDPERVAAEMAAYAARAQAEADAEHEPDDAGAETVRLRVPDVAPMRALSASA
jgi:glycerol-3-phosphate dehydrogenase